MDILLYSTHWYTGSCVGGEAVQNVLHHLLHQKKNVRFVELGIDSSRLIVRCAAGRREASFLVCSSRVTHLYDKQYQARQRLIAR